MAPHLIFIPKFEKLISPYIQGKLLPEYFKNNFLERQAFEIVKGTDQMEEFWERLKTSFGNVVILLNDKLSEVVINAPPPPPLIFYLGDEIKYDEPSSRDAEIDLRKQIAENKFNGLSKYSHKNESENSEFQRPQQADILMSNLEFDKATDGSNRLKRWLSKKKGDGIEFRAKQR